MRGHVMSTRFRVEVEEAGVGGVALVLDRPDLTPAQQAAVRDIVEPVLASLTHDERLALLAVLVEQYADERAYERVCEQRGLLL